MYKIDDTMDLDTTVKSLITRATVLDILANVKIPTASPKHWNMLIRKK